MPNDQNSRRQPRHLRFYLLDAIHDQRSRRASVHLYRRESVRMRMVPIESRRFILRNLRSVCECRRERLNQRGQHVILMARGRNVQTVKMHIGRKPSYGPTLARSLHHRHRSHAPHPVTLRRLQRIRDQLVGEVQDQLVARVQIPRRRLHSPARRLIIQTIVQVAITVNRVLQRQAYRQSAVRGLQAEGVRHHAPRCRTRRAV